MRLEVNSMRTRTQILMLIVPFVIYLASMAMLGNWIIDDAGISYAYARNVAYGYGFVSQPGRPPVEGFSNFLWVLFLVPFFKLGIFHPVITAKCLGIILVFSSMAILYATLHRQIGNPFPGFLTNLLIAGAPPMVIWTASGLENSLTMFLAVLLYSQLVAKPRHWEVKSGLLASLLAMTHPENVLYIAAGGLVCLLSPLFCKESLSKESLSKESLFNESVFSESSSSEPSSSESSSRESSSREPASREPVSNKSLSKKSLFGAVRSAGKQIGSFALLFAPFIAFRLAVFGLPFPHTYYAKRVYPSLLAHLADMLHNPAASWNKLVGLCRGIAGPLGPLLILLSIAAAFYLILRRKLSRPLAVALAIQAISVGAYMWMDEDWMGEYRFATVAAIFSLLLLVLAGYMIFRDLANNRGRRWLFIACFSGILLIYTDYIPRMVTFGKNPTTPFSDVARNAFRFNKYAEVLGLKQPSVFLPDIGAVLYYSKLRVYDVAGLIEPDVIQTLKQGTIYWLWDHPQFYDYVFEKVKPTFISTHEFFTLITALELDPRLSRDYLAINAYQDEYLQRVYGRTLRSGDFVRKDALKNPGDLEKLRTGYEAPSRPDPVIERSIEWLSSLFEIIRYQNHQNDQNYQNDQKEAALMSAALDARYAQNNPNRAVTLLKRLIEKHPDSFAATYQMASALDAAGRIHEARSVWQDVLRLSQVSADQHIFAIAYDRLEGDPMEAGLEALVHQHKFDRAIEYFRLVLEQNPAHYGATCQLAVALDLEGRRAEARAYWTKALEMAKDHGDKSTEETARKRLKVD